VRIEVRDSGIGISPEHQEAIFDEFYQVANPARDRRLGLGLGLAIVARIARLLRTEVRVRSAPGRGSTFFLQQPLAPEGDVAPMAQRSRATVSEDGEAALSVLIVDDDPIALSGSRVLLEELGCSVTTATDAASAQSAIERLGSAPVLVLCDLWLSDDRSGMGVLQRLRRLARAPVYGVLVSGDTRPETIQLARDAGFALLHTPVSPARMRAFVMQFAARGRALAIEPAP
jgi:CheY-like chemotaxis protein